MGESRKYLWLIEIGGVLGLLLGYLFDLNCTSLENTKEPKNKADDKKIDGKQSSIQG